MLAWSIRRYPIAFFLSLLSYTPSEEGSIKMHRTITSADVMEYSTEIPARDVDLVEEEDIEYRSGRLIKSNGTMHLSVERGRQEDTDSDDNLEQQFSNVFNARGSFNMELKLCRLVPLTARRRRNAVRQNLNGAYSSEESLMASYDKGIELEKFRGVNCYKFF